MTNNTLSSKANAHSRLTCSNASKAGAAAVELEAPVLSGFFVLPAVASSFVVGWLSLAADLVVAEGATV